MSEDINEKIRYLKVLTELQLHPKIKILSENSHTQNKKVQNKEKEEEIEKFINNLPEYLKNIDGCKSIILETLEKVDKNIKKIQEQEER